MRLPLPTETREFFGNDKNRLLRMSNLGLLFSKYVYSWQNGWQMEEKDKRQFREEVSKASFAREYVSAVYSRQKATVERIRHSDWHVESFELTTDNRLIIGLGGTSVIETGMTLHPLYGFPYLPASGLKGLARAYAEIGGDASREELHEIFGSEDKDSRRAAGNRQGKVFFIDGLPVTFPKLDLDIMNPHYSEYYQGDKPPADYLNPVPVTFLTVAAGQTFSFCLYSRNEELAEKAKKWLVMGLAELGAGGKTNVGYGYFHKSLAEPANTANSNEDAPPETDPSDSLMEKLFKQVGQCRGAEHKETLVRAFDKAKALPSAKRPEFFHKAVAILPDKMKGNKGIRALLKELQREFEADQ